MKATLLLLVLALLAQVRLAAHLSSRLDTHQLPYNWAIGRWLEGVYEGEHAEYTAHIATLTDPSDLGRWARAATTQARDWAQARRDLEHALANHQGTLRDITTAEAGFRLPHDVARLATVPSSLRGGLFFRPLRWAPTSRLLYERSLQMMRTNPEAHARLRSLPPTEPPRLALLNRPDLDVVLFLPAGAPAPAGWAAGPEQVEVATASGLVRYDAFRADLYGEVEVSRLDGGAFVVVKRRF